MSRQQQSRIEIEESDIESHVDQSDDFAFEMQTFQKINPLSDAQHNGTYIDPVTQKPREFDIRANIRWDNADLKLAIECKNISKYNPLVISCVNRSHSEIYHSVICRDKGRLEVVSGSGYYVEGEWVGKSCFQLKAQEQVTKTKDADRKSKQDTVRTYNASDSEVYDKWTQAIQSCYDLIRQSNDPPNGRDQIRLTWVVPMVVVPDGTLWRIRYNSDGLRQVAEQADSVSYYVGRDCEVETIQTPFRISHLEFITQSGLVKFCSNFRQTVRNPTLFRKLFNIAEDKFIHRSQR